MTPHPPPHPLRAALVAELERAGFRRDDARSERWTLEGPSRRAFLGGAGPAMLREAHERGAQVLGAALAAGVLRELLSVEAARFDDDEGARRCAYAVCALAWVRAEEPARILARILEGKP